MTVDWEGAAKEGVNAEAVMKQKKELQLREITPHEALQQWRKLLRIAAAKMLHSLPKLILSGVDLCSHCNSTSWKLSSPSRQLFRTTMIRFIARRFPKFDSAANTAIGDSLPMPSLIIERLYYAEGRHHPQHPLHGSHAGLGCW